MRSRRDGVHPRPAKRGEGCTVLLVLTIIAVLAPSPAQAAATLDGAALGWFWALPFIGILLTIATGPLLFPRFWHRHYGKLAFAWSALTLARLAHRQHGDARLRHLDCQRGQDHRRGHDSDSAAHPR